MNPIYTETKNRLHKKILSKGFKSKNKSYYKLLDGFVQGMKIYTNYQSYSIRFFQLPLCSDIDLSFEGDDVSIFWTNITGPFSVGELYAPDMVGWIKNPFDICLTEDNYVNEASEILTRCYDEYILPYFTESSSLEKAYKSYLKLHEDLSEQHFEWMLQMKNYDKALKFLNFRLNTLQTYAKKNNCRIEKIDELMLCKVNIEQKKYDFVEKYVLDKEKKTMINLGFKR